MFDPVTDEVLRRRRTGLVQDLPRDEAGSRTLLVCSVCGREIGTGEQIFWVGGEIHCSQCHSMLEFEYDRERKVDREMRDKGTRWQKRE